MKGSAIEDTIDLVKKLAYERLTPHAREADKSHSFPKENLRALSEAGFMGLIISEEDAGSGAGRDGFASVVTEISKACASTALIYVSHSIVAKAIELFGSPLIKEKWLNGMLEGEKLGAFAVHEPDSGSNSGAITTRARRNGNHYIVNGSKFFITSAGEASDYLVLVRSAQGKDPQGLTTFLIEKDTPGLSFGQPEDKMGLTSTSSRQMFFSDCRVPKEYLLGRESSGTEVIGSAVVGWGFFGAAALSVGIAKAAAELAIKHAKERTIAGEPIAIHQAVQFMITDMILGSEASDAFLHECAYRADLEDNTAVVNGFKAKLYASEMAVDVTNKGIQVMGGHGYCRDHVVERLFRDARGLTLHFKTSEWLRQDIAKSALGL
jgi:butyryl-CoA dehydrogenase